jgi:hypothetical protein
MLFQNAIPLDLWIFKTPKGHTLAMSIAGGLDSIAAGFKQEPADAIEKGRP